MDDLSEKMRERLEKWRNRGAPTTSSEKEKPKDAPSFVGKGDYGDALTLEQWEWEAKRSQVRK